MKRMVIIAGLIALSTPGLVRAQCLQYEPNVVSLSGVIVRETHPGRPNYSSVAEGDEPETIWVLKLEKAICVLAGNDTHADPRFLTSVRYGNDAVLLQWRST